MDPSFVDKIFSTAERIQIENPRNLCTKHLSRHYFDSFENEEDKFALYRCIKTGIDNVHSSLGCYAMRPNDYTTFKDFFDKIILDYHGNAEGKRHETDWRLSVTDRSRLDLSHLGLKNVSMRIRVSRNLASYNLPGLMSKDERIRFEQDIISALKVLIDTSGFGGTIYSLSPNWGKGVRNPYLINDLKYQELVENHVMFKDMSSDPFLRSAGISSNWPFGRGCWQSADKECIIWYGEEDQLRIMCMKKGTNLASVFDRLRFMLESLESIESINFVRSGEYGYVSSCPSNLGTGMRASVHIRVPRLTAGGSVEKVKSICNRLDLSVRGVGGEHTSIGSDGTIDLSPRRRLFIRERDIILSLVDGIEAVMKHEQCLSSSKL